MTNFNGCTLVTADYEVGDPLAPELGVTSARSVEKIGVSTLLDVKGCLSAP